MWKIIIFVSGLISLGLSSEELCVEDKIVDLPVELPHNIFCENVDWTGDNETTTLTQDHKYMVFRNSKIILSESFLDKFPNCAELYFDNVQLELVGVNDSSNHLLSSIYLNGCNVSGSLNFFGSLRNLKHFAAFNNHFQYNILDKSLFDKNTNLKVLTLYQNNLAKIDRDFFDGLQSLEVLTFSENFETFPVNISSMDTLIYLDLSGNNLTEIPCKWLPENIIELSFPGNNIRKPSFSECLFMKSLKRLYLSGNGIESLDSNLFDEFENIEEIYLDNNELQNVTEKEFTKLGKLKRISLVGNLIPDEILKSLEGRIVKKE